MSEQETQRAICLANWPEAENGAYNPNCCRFPKSCSIPPVPVGQLYCALCGRPLMGGGMELLVNTNQEDEKLRLFCNDASGCRRTAYQRFVVKRNASID